MYARRAFFSVFSTNFFFRSTRQHSGLLILDALQRLMFTRFTMKLKRANVKVLNLFIASLLVVGCCGVSFATHFFNAFHHILTLFFLCLYILISLNICYGWNEPTKQRMKKSNNNRKINALNQFCVYMYMKSSSPTFAVLKMSFGLFFLLFS